MALIRMCVVPNCSQRPSWPSPVDCDCLCHLLDTEYCCLCPSGSLNPLSASHPPTHPLIRTIYDITVAMKKVAQNPAVLASYSRNSYRTLVK